MQRYIFSLLLLAALCLSVSAETLSGKVTDAQGNPIPYATISVLAQDSALLTGTITDETGQYRLETPATPHIVQASFIGYHTAFGGPDFVLREETEQLGEVEVKAKRPLVERQMDKLVLNVSSSPFALGSNGKDLLKKAPGVNIDKDGNVTVNGKSVQVYIDGRPSHLNGEQLKAMLEGTDGSTIEKIEIISNPSAKYDAAGQGGIINIKTKRNMMQGLNGTLSAAYGGMYFGAKKRYFQQDFVSLNLNYRTEKTYTYMQLTQVYADGAASLEAGADYPVISGTDTIAHKRVSRSEYDYSFQYYMAKIGNDWFIDKKNTLGFILNIPVMKMNQKAPETALSRGWTVQQTALGWDTLETNSSATGIGMLAPQYTANLNYTHVFSDSLERELTANVDYNRYNTHNTNAQHNTFRPAGSSDSTAWLDIDTRQTMSIYSAKLDFQTRFWGTGMLEAGAKWALSATDNRMTTDSVLNNLPRPTAHSDFDYREHVAALYITAGRQFGKHWNAKLGLRGEYTFSHGNWITADSVTERSYFNLFPTAFVGYNPTDKWGLSLSYTRRIDRPGYYQLNPFVTYVDAHAYMEGNPGLMPQFTHSLEWQTNYSQYVSLAVGFSHTKGTMTQRMSVLPNGDTRIRWENFGTQMQVGANITLTEIPIVPKYENHQLAGAWLALTANAGYYYKMNRSDDFRRNNHFGYVSATLSSYLPKDWTLSLDGYWYSPNINGYEYSSGFYGMGFAVRKTYMPKGLIFGLQVQDLLRSSHWSSHSLYLPEGQYTWTRQTNYQQRVMLSLTWMFGQMQYTKRRNVGNVEEASRLGSGSSLGTK